jgi:LysR family glycine cleavage system transcriptional activator
MPSLNALRAFEAAARLGHFGKAASELSVTPSAVAQQIRQLEDWLGCPLFQRFAQSVRVTDAAREALPPLIQGFDTLGDAVRRLRASHGPRDLSICSLPSIAQLWLSPRLPRLRNAFPDLEVSVSAEEEPPSFHRDLYDLALFYATRAKADVIAIPLAEDALFPVCSPELIADEPPGFSLDDLARQTLLHDAAWREDWPRWLEYAGVQGIGPQRGPVFSLYSLAIEAAIAGGGFLMGRRNLVGGLLASGLLVAPFQLHMPLPERLTILLPCRKPPHPFQEKVVGWLQRECLENE